jgi:steroid delta-isomerase-like uncharacterized protein
MRKLVLAFAALLLGSAAWAGPVQERNKAVARRVFEEILSQGKFELGEQFYAPDFVNHGFSRNITLKEDQDAARGWRTAMPDLKLTVVMMVTERDLVTVLWNAEGTNTGEGNGLPATGKKVQGRGITIWRIVNGKIREEWSEFDQLRMMKQLGLIPAQK